MYTIDLSANVPTYGQEQCIWCGAASGQMIRNGYPNPADRLYYAQIDVWNTIQAHNSTDPADLNWATDPHGLTGALQALSNPAGVHWAEFAGTSRDGVLFDMLYWMNKREFPCGVLVNQGGHWVVVVGFVTDVAPVAGSTPNLQSISFHDPEPHNVGTDTTMTGAQWFAGPWNGSIIYSGTWYNQYVAVVEPPIVKGKAQVKSVKRTGKKLLTPAEALNHAQRWVNELKLAEQNKYSFLSRDDVRSFTPMLVREQPPGSKAKNVPHYYIVPFGSSAELGGRAARVCVLVNAYSGQFEEVTVFGQPVRYLSEEEALDIVRGAMQKDNKSFANAEIMLMFQPSDITHVRTWPFWQVTVGKRIMYVDQLGKLYGKLLPSIPGD